ncbi:Serine/threonine-protein kinase MPS1 [Colletotrichum chlorophyti]|uniref:Serine/threonine-protein kinase MPS1 n=1 Tax=Colletotrichum chlorophyti TaxID=708187 RepID=A0A1Q8R9S7_9PEZI|nr:Serine/threonine-protein kinase MPS1 [Colletotrichum chlorophyti]
MDMSTASPTPMGTGTGLSRRPSQRQGLRRLPSRPHLNRSESNPVHATESAPALSRKADSQPYAMHDSSDDEIPVPMKLSALTKALLNDGGEPESGRAPEPPRTRRRASNLAASTASATEERRSLRSGSAQVHDARSSRPASPLRSRENSPVRKRIVRLSNTPKSLGQMGPTKRRSTSLSRSTTQRSQSRSRPESREQSSDEKPELPQNVNTPAQGVRVVRIAAGSSGNRSRLTNSSSHSRRSGSHLEQEYLEEPVTAARHPSGINPGSVSRHTSNGGRNVKPEDNPALQSSMRVKRVGKIPGSFLSGPARRGRRRQSEEEAEANGDGEGLASGQDHDGHGFEMDNDLASSFYRNGREPASGSPLALSDPSRASHRRPVSHAESAPPAHPSPRERDEPEEIHYRLPAPRSRAAPLHDQENDIPSILRTSKPAVNRLSDQDAEKIHKRPLASASVHHRPTASPERKPLASLTNNTPRRPAPPPPPKMSVLDAATTSAGAATTSQGKQRRNILRVNGKSYTRLDCLGRGGSAKVYRVTAENGAMFALKRVALENADQATIRGYRGEIDLLSKLTGVDRVINLFDYEMNDEKRILTLLMEMGELDLNTLLRSRQNPEAAKFDPVFVRFYWKEMLECLQSVHHFDIVHSDLKPANFVLVKGRLKLIDFGIANAIQTDETVNVHRETQIGTPNYMSPESLMDFNAPRGGRVPGQPKLMKVGKPSDVWSLGCILYQFVYGVPPFGHIANQMARCQAIINWDHTIEFPSRGMGGVAVPPSLLRTMRRCLNRDVHMRPTCEELLHETDPFLYPNEMSEKALPIDEELLGRIIQSVVTRCRERMPTEAEAMSVWPSAYWASVKKATNPGRS